MANLPDSRPSTFGLRLSTAFTLVEIMVVVTLLSLIVLALMAVFNSTQQAFRASITQSDVLEGGRAALDFMAGDLRAISPSRVNNTNDVHFYVAVTNYTTTPSPLYQTLVASSIQRTNVLENFFILNRGNLDGVPTWFGVGYAVSTNQSPGALYSL
jgi:type II secretory pathway pseudopilin PulG